MDRGTVRLARVLDGGARNGLRRLSRPDAACAHYGIDGLRHSGTIGIGHHVPSILNEVQDGTAQRPV